MAKARAIVKRRKAVQNIRKITRTMQLIATARFQAAYNRAVAAKPYTERITQLVGQLSARQADVDHPLIRQNPDAKRVVHIVLTSNRGLAGGYNGLILRASVERMRATEADGRTVELHAVGKKGISYFRFLGRAMARTDTKFEDKPRFADVDAIASALIDAYERGEIHAVYVTYMRFISTAVQKVDTFQLLPVERPRPAEQQPAAAESTVQFEFTPSPAELLDELVPEMVKVRLFQAFMDAAVSEQVARMVAMQGATEAAGKMIKSLTQQYNRARQSQITLELLDIVSGANALK